jgi:hypothetical protein
MSRRREKKPPVAYATRKTPDVDRLVRGATDKRIGFRRGDQTVFVEDPAGSIVSVSRVFCLGSRQLWSVADLRCSLCDEDLGLERLGKSVPSRGWDELDLSLGPSIRSHATSGLSVESLSVGFAVVQTREVGTGASMHVSFQALRHVSLFSWSER